MSRLLTFLFLCAIISLSSCQQPAEESRGTIGYSALELTNPFFKVIADTMKTWYDNVVANIQSGDTTTFNEAYWDPSTWPAEARGVGYMEAPRGALAHWIVIKNGKIDNYQAVVPSTWNAGPRDPEGQPGPYEAALQDNHELHDPEQPVEILRTIHSFDPCIACAVHVTDPDGEELVKVKVR